MDVYISEACVAHFANLGKRHSIIEILKLNSMIGLTGLMQCILIKIQI